MSLERIVTLSSRGEIHLLDRLEPKAGAIDLHCGLRLPLSECQPYDQVLHGDRLPCTRCRQHSPQTKESKMFETAFIDELHELGLTAAADQCAAADTLEWAIAAADEVVAATKKLAAADSVRAREAYRYALQVRDELRKSAAVAGEAA